MSWIPVILILPYLIILLKIYRSLLYSTTYYLSSDPSTFISVVVACRNEQDNLPSLLNSIALQDYPGKLFEVIIVNDWSTDNSIKIAERYTGISNLITLNNKGNGKKLALRTGIAIARGELIISTDADCKMGKNWIRTIAAFYELNKPDLIICPVRTEPVRGMFGKFQELEFLSLQGVTAGSALLNNASMCNGANLAFTKKVYLDHSDDLHDEINSGDDVFLLHSIKKEDRSKVLWLESPDSLVITKPSPTLWSFIKQRSRWLSKGRAYKDRFTIVLGGVTFIAIILQAAYFFALIFHPYLIWCFLTILVLKSVPDFLILYNTSVRYKREELMKWFIPTQIIYPFYVLCVAFYSLISKEIRIINSPSQKGT